ncbi:hypothetical protein [Roseateles koreensis]|uniref:Uncharacterized protein n=1 Tax=Roseateles koreensis TaxID=2987526 RepID=A0ABT5KW01_9BURK|nr:hypothetical protein [Roseateles koreensis]MDC8787121.1 hypothetical protein [Roseateles koreensis]
MNVKKTFVEHSAPGPNWLCLLLALCASTISLAVSVQVGWQRGGSNTERLLLASVGVIAVLAGHLLPSQCSSAPLRLRLIGYLVWSACMAYAAYSHASFLIDVQEQIGQRRVDAIDSAPLADLVAQPRNLSAILEERSKVMFELTRRSRVECEDKCAANRARLTALNGHIASLDAEAEEVRAWKDKRDQLDRRRIAARDDPVTARLASTLSVSRESARWITVLPITFILEGLGCLCWSLHFQNRNLAGRGNAVRTARRNELHVAPAIESVTAPIAVTTKPLPVTDGTTHSVIAVGSITKQTSRSEIEDWAAVVWPEIVAGRVKPTVKEIRDYLKIAQEKARHVRKIVCNWIDSGGPSLPPVHRDSPLLPL